ncbi:MAG: hypothetical protein C5B57_07900 [Blastocatellia bacterium]|nr:MAG: hypothetical protein C5B57_07900 [Blastocatellia bacterium]
MSLDSHRPARSDPDSDDARGTGSPDTWGTDTLQIRDYARIVYRRRWIIFLIVVAGLIGGALYNWTAPRIFEAGATLQIEGDTNILALDRPLVDQRDWMSTFLPTQVGILMSADLARTAHDELTSSEAALPPNERLSQVPTVAEIAAARSIGGVKDTRLVNVGFRSTDPEIAARVANALARAYVRWNVEYRSKMTGEASAWLSRQVEEQRKLLEASETALQAYRRDHGADALVRTNQLGEERQNIVVQKLGDLQAAVTRARADTIEKDAQIKQMSALEADHKPLDTLPAIAANPFIQTLKGELTTSERELGQASKELGEHHPTIIKLREAVQNADRKLQAEIAAAAHTIRNDFEAAQSREQALEAALDRSKREVQALNAKAVEYSALEREAASNREVLDKLLQRSTEARLARELESTNIRIVDSAEIPTVPSLPRQTHNLMLAFAGSSSLALVLVFVLEVFNTRVTSVEDVKRHLRIPVLGLMPQVPSKNGRVPLLVQGAPARLTELFQAARTNLIMAPELARPHILLVTSSEPGEGKTVTAANLAASLAGLHQRVLLIDADLRKPGLHQLFGEEQQPGLADVLAGKTTSRDFRQTKISRLWLLPAGTASRHPADLLGSERFSRLIDYLQKQFDWIVIDSSPVLAVTDPCVIARVASGALLVVRSGRTSRDVASAAVERLDAVGANVVGAMLNGVVLDQPGRSYLPYYHREYPAYYCEQTGSSWIPKLPDAAALQGDSTRAAAPPANS